MLGKTNLLNAIAGKKRGNMASQTEKQAILAAIASLEDLNPTPRPFEALNVNLLDGNWRLVYTTSQELLNLDRIPLCQVNSIYQCIRVADKTIYNLAEISGLPYLEGLISVAAKFEPISERRVQVKFERGVVGLQRFLRYQSPNDLINRMQTGNKLSPIDFAINSDRQQGWLDITYLDEDLRIGRGNEGSVFVLTKT
ncbi:PAP/fibrillin family protein [Calothrix sp. 336/3]|uniref:PAP/fibrillin family protein n=1 Tax=Calothrix sp. 336/3 TaxID=1337936 RepID=UPI0004E30B4C|nr:PAP/fibrillin family protein [Calothrix sp. 336/3]AKG23159.1 fibrillin [Calothrix sp. 336/3]